MDIKTKLDFFLLQEFSRLLLTSPVNDLCERNEATLTSLFDSCILTHEEKLNKFLRLRIDFCFHTGEI